MAKQQIPKVPKSVKKQNVSRNDTTQDAFFLYDDESHAITPIEINKEKKA